MSNTPKKGDVIISPTTQRPIRVGGVAWLNLVKQGLLAGHYTDDKKIAKAADTPEEINEQIGEINKTLPRGKQAVRGRGKYKGQITTRNVKPDIAEVSRYTAKIASKIVNENIESLAESDNLEDELERLIMQEMANSTQATPVKKSKAANKKEEKYTLQAPQKYDEEEEEEEEEDSEEEEEDSEEETEYF